MGESKPCEHEVAVSVGSKSALKGGIKTVDGLCKTERGGNTLGKEKANEVVVLVEHSGLKVVTTLDAVLNTVETCDNTLPFIRQVEAMEAPSVLSMLAVCKDGQFAIAFVLLLGAILFGPINLAAVTMEVAACNEEATAGVHATKGLTVGTHGNLAVDWTTGA